MLPQFSCVPLRSTSENCAVLPCFSDFGCFQTAHFLTFPDFHHLMGLGKLKDLRIAKQNRGSVFDEIITGITTYETLTKSRYLAQIENRFEPLALVEQLLDDNRLVFRYNTKLNQFSLIEADYLLSTPFENSDIYIFIAEHKDTGKYFCRSFFPKEKKDYTEGQPRYTMLYKEKRNMATGEIAVQYDRLTPKNKP